MGSVALVQLDRNVLKESSNVFAAMGRWVDFLGSDGKYGMQKDSMYILKRYKLKQKLIQAVRKMLPVSSPGPDELETIPTTAD
jgi:hypothetical protein